MLNVMLVVPLTPVIVPLDADSVKSHDVDAVHCTSNPDVMIVLFWSRTTTGIVTVAVRVAGFASVDASVMVVLGQVTVTALTYGSAGGGGVASALHVRVREYTTVSVADSESVASTTALNTQDPAAPDGGGVAVKVITPVVGWIATLVIETPSPVQSVRLVESREIVYGPVPPDTLAAADVTVTAVSPAAPRIR